MATPAQPDPVLYRKVTEALLLRYTSMSLDAGRVPSLMGREVFPGNVTHARRTGFDDFAHFVHDFANCLKLLSPGQQYLLRRIAMHGYSQSEVAAMVGISLRSINRRYAEAVDRLTTVLIERKLLEPNKALAPDELIPGSCLTEDPSALMEAPSVPMKKPPAPAEEPGGRARLQACR
jgi:hypothetical protein